tara:strand:- start:6434 stop:6781 length:348 start_codon:yes stop_codon:yes gene_type:complete
MKRKIPNLNKENISKNYRKAFSTVDYFLECCQEKVDPRTKHLSKRSFLHRKIQKYGEYFDSEEYKDVVNESNCDVISKLDDLVDQLNKFREQKNLEVEELILIIKQINFIIGSEK